MNLFQFISKNKSLIGILIILIIAVVSENNIKVQLNELDEFDNIQKILKKKIAKVDKVLEDIEFSMDSLTLNELMYNKSFIDEDLFEKEGIVFLGYSEDSLVYWTDNSIPVENFYVDNELYSDAAKLKNGWYVIRQNYIDDYELFGLILIKNEYSYQNDFVKSDFFYEYNLDIPVYINLDIDNGFQIKDNDENYLFSFNLNSNVAYNNLWIYLSSFLYFVFIILLFIRLRSFFIKIKSEKRKKIYLLILAVVLILIRYLMLDLKIPAVFKKLELFQPHHFAISSIVPSLGDLFLHASFVFFFITVFYKVFKFNVSLRKGVSIYVNMIFTLFTFLFFVGINHYFRSLILHSSISFEGYNFFDLSFYSLVGYIIIALFLTSLFLFIDHFFKSVKNDFTLKQVIIIFIPFLILLVLFANYFFIEISLYSVGFIIFLVCFIGYVRIKKKEYSYPTRIVFLLFFALYTVLVITETSDKKDKETRKVLAVNLANEHDQIAEMLLEGLEMEIENDTVIRDLLTWHIQNEGAILEHLQMNYFSGYFRKYDLQISVCNPNDDLTLENENSIEIVYCYGFFEDYLKNEGVELPGSRFYFLDNQDGRISYLGQFVYKKPEWQTEVSLYISLDSKLVSQELGYPELLLDSRMTGSTILSDYSYAKYKYNDLMTRSGNFAYQLRFPDFWDSSQEYYFTSDQNYEHLVYKIDNDTTIVISNSKLKFVDILASFSYIFVFYFILLTIVFFVIQFPNNIKGFNYDFKNKIKFSMIGVLLLSLVIVGFGTIYYNINQFERNLYESISEKIQSVLVEMEHKLGGELELTSDYSDYLTYLLTKFSNVFYIDINLYDVNGNLLASSRSQVFEKGLMGNKMNNKAYDQMVIQKSGKFIHKESVGDLTYYSAYVPFTNDENVLLAYLNLPYFTKQSALKKEIYTIVVAVVNIYFFLILLSIIVAIFISNNITKPLQTIQERFRAIDLGKKNEPIIYSNQDEIGSLIKEYNRMVGELSQNAEKLAKSERESAWREMAKQIAHEIKNPLTPMKLSVQYLQKAWKDNIPDFDKRLEKFSNSLISQINNLSSIATEFSNFAKMPKTRAEQVDIIAKLNDIITLFENTDNVIIHTDFGDTKELFVLADKEQLLIVFSNLIQNGIQAVPKERKGEITVSVEEQLEHVKITVRDNGKGIPNELKHKLFIPNFTTKTSGMGLGLAIVKNIIEDSGGEIWYHTELDVGTSFFVTFPKFKHDE